MWKQWRLLNSGDDQTILGGGTDPQEVTTNPWDGLDQAALGGMPIKFKANHAERTATLDELTKLAALGIGAEEKFREAAAQRKESERQLAEHGQITERLANFTSDVDSFVDIMERAGATQEEAEVLWSALKGNKQSAEPAKAGQEQSKMTPEIEELLKFKRQLDASGLSIADLVNTTKGASGLLERDGTQRGRNMIRDAIKGHVGFKGKIPVSLLDTITARVYDAADGEIQRMTAAGQRPDLHQVIQSKLDLEARYLTETGAIQGANRGSEIPGMASIGGGGSNLPPPRKTTNPIITREHLGNASALGGAIDQWFSNTIAADEQQQGDMLG